jgi:hypothetical protein
MLSVPINAGLHIQSVFTKTHIHPSTEQDPLSSILEDHWVSMAFHVVTKSPRSRVQSRRRNHL